MGTAPTHPMGGNGTGSVLVLASADIARVVAAVRDLKDRRPPGTRVMVAVPEVGARWFQDLGPDVAVWSIGLQEMSLDEPWLRSKIASARFDEIVIPLGFPRRALLHVDRFIRDHPSLPITVDSPMGRTSNRTLMRIAMFLLTFAIFVPFGLALRAAHVVDAMCLLATAYVVRWTPRKRSDESVRSVTHVIASLGTGGAQRQLVEYLRRACAAGRDIEVVSVLAGDRAFVGALEGLSVDVTILSEHDETSPGGGSWFAAAFPNSTELVKITNRLRRSSPDCIVGWLFPTTMIAATAGRLAGCPRIVATDRNMSRWKGEPPYGRWWHRRLDRFGVRLVDTIVVNSNRTADDFHRWAGCPGEKIAVVHNGVDARDLIRRPYADVRAELGISDGETVLLNVGRLSYEKNQVELVRLALQLKERDLEFRIVIVGHGDLGPGLELLSERLGVAREVIFTGRRNDPQSFYRCADVFVLPSLFEGLPNAVLEAQAFGLPVIAYDVGGNAEIIVDGRTGSVLPPPEKRRFEEAVVRLITDPDLRRRMGAAARERVRSEFSVDKMVAGIDTICGLAPSRG